MKKLIKPITVVFYYEKTHQTNNGRIYYEKSLGRMV